MFYFVFDILIIDLYAWKFTALSESYHINLQTSNLDHWYEMKTINFIVVINWLKPLNLRQKHEITSNLTR